MDDVNETNETPSLPEVKFPDKIIEELKFHCNANNLAMMHVGNDFAGCLIVGVKSLGASQASILIAYMLLAGVVEGHIDEGNREVREQELSTSPKIN